MRDEIKVFTGNGNRALAQEICDHLGIELGKAEIRRFSNENIFVQVQENVRERDVFVVQPLSSPVSENLVELLIMMDALKSASARRITAVIPYYSYARSDKKDMPRISIAGRLDRGFAGDRRGEPRAHHDAALRAGAGLLPLPGRPSLGDADSGGPLPVVGAGELRGPRH